MSSNRKYDEPAIPETIIDTNRGITYVKGKFYGKGGFAKCYEIKDISNGNVFAGKIVSKKLLVKTNQKEKMAQEINIHRNIKHEHIVGFHSFFEDDHFVYVVLELCHKRSMMELHRRRKALTEPETRYYMKQILEGVLYLHENGIIHRDLKLGNLFLNENLEVKIGDFGLAARIEFEGQRKRTLCGTPNYIAPEILTKAGHGSEVDIWSIGCIMYTLLVGIPPFESKSLRETYERIKRCEYKLPSSVRHSAAALINRMLQPDPKKRPTVKEILYSEFITSGYLPSKLPVTCLMVAPRFDSAIDNSRQMTFNNRKPLIEVNDNSPIVNRSIKVKGNGDENARGKGMLTKLSTNNDCFRNLMDLRRQLITLLQDIQVNKQMNDELTEEMTDPAAQPVVWISKWVDYSDKYGFGYQLCDSGFGVMFNDNTRILLHPNQKNIHYINQAGTEFYHTVENTPSSLEKKVKLLNYFRRYMDVHLMRAGAAVPVLESDQLSRIPYLHQWRRTKTAVLMHLTNGTVQINFNDHKKIIMCPLMSAVTYIDLDKNFRTYRFSTISSNGCVNGLKECLKYAFEQIDSICSKETVSGY